jgi:hypothetical protein
METLVLHSILHTELGHFFVCLVVTQDSEKLTCHKIETSNGVDVIMPPQDLDKETHDNLKDKLIYLLDKTME